MQVVVLFCRVMPRLTSSTPAVTEAHWSWDEIDILLDILLDTGVMGSLVLCGIFLIQWTTTLVLSWRSSHEQWCSLWRLASMSQHCVNRTTMDNRVLFCISVLVWLEDVLRGSDFSINASYFQDLFSLRLRPNGPTEFLLVSVEFYLAGHADRILSFWLRSNHACKPLADHASVLCFADVSHE